MEPELKAYKPAVRELASRIYSDLVLRSVTIAESTVSMATSADNLAKLSFKLADAFEKVEHDLNAENMPKNQGFRVEASDIAKWSK